MTLKSTVIVLSLSIYPPIEILSVLMPAQADILQIQQNILLVGVTSRVVGRMVGHRVRGSGR
jgi:hypothetical protein